jgi:hypothetical protein
MNKTLDKTFSEYIRLRDSDEYGMIHCISCSTRVKWKEADAGHFVNRRHQSLRFDEYNVNAQCRRCNRLENGNIEGYKRGLIAKYGRWILEYLENKKNEIVKFNDFELELMGLNYGKKVRELSK